MTERERPHVFIVGGFLTSPPLYWGMRDALRARGAASVAIAPVWTPDWLIAGWVGLGPLMRRTAKAVVRAYRQAGGRPLLVVGHSAGGVLARLATSPAPFQGHRAGVAEAYGALVTIGTPHRTTEPAGRRNRAAHDATSFLDRTIPGAWFAPRTGYLTVGSRYAMGGPADDPDRRRRMTGALYAMVGGEAARTGWGDGLIPERCQHLDAARRLTLEGVIHGQSMGDRWYGSGPVVDDWWPAAVEVWRAALAVRQVATTSAEAALDREPSLRTT